MASSHKHSALHDFLHNNLTVDHRVKDDTLLDVHVGNPLRKIAGLLEDIKKQKAFAFSLKGSLGAAGIVVALGTFGVLGGTKAFCSKGVQSHIGKIMPLNIVASQNDSVITRLSGAWDGLTGNISAVRAANTPPPPWVILEDQDNSVWHITGYDFRGYVFSPAKVIVTGDIDTCGKTINVSSPVAVQQVPFQ